ncbi:NYN domain-containing protein [Streptomyces sp. NPDC001941]|uniref:NYN domain-containing protein n=1 Tax=Streptomyces sp. NPDC001941 TaxID=3154659 RepID=UPI00331EF531
MDRCIVLVDVGYLLGAAATLLTGDPARARLAIDYPGLIQRIGERAQAVTGLPLLRTYWFDAAPDRVPQPAHRRLRVMPRVTVRLGLLTRSGGRAQQKGVDAAIQAQLVELARHQAAADIVLITGDGDLLPGVMTAKEHGVALHLWAVQAADGDYNQSEDLIAEADERLLLDRAWLTQTITAAPTMAIPDPPVQRGPAPPASTLPQPTVSAPAPVLTRAPSPADLAHTTPPPRPPAASWGGQIPLLESLTNASQARTDRNDDLTASGDPRELGRTFAQRWTSRLPDTDAADLIGLLGQDQPRIPPALDGELLRYAARFDASTAHDISEDCRVQLRAGFWLAVEESRLAHCSR